RIRKGLKDAPRRIASRCPGVVMRMGSTDLMRKGSMMVFTATPIRSIRGRADPPKLSTARRPEIRVGSLISPGPPCGTFHTSRAGTRGPLAYQGRFPLEGAVAGGEDVRIEKQEAPMVRLARISDPEVQR